MWPFKRNKIKYYLIACILSSFLNTYSDNGTDSNRFERLKQDISDVQKGKTNIKKIENTMHLIDDPAIVSRIRENTIRNIQIVNENYNFIEKQIEFIQKKLKDYQVEEINPADIRVFLIDIKNRVMYCIEKLEKIEKIAGDNDSGIREMLKKILRKLEDITKGYLRYIKMKSNRSYIESYYDADEGLLANLDNKLPRLLTEYEFIGKKL